MSFEVDIDLASRIILAITALVITFWFNHQSSKIAKDKMKKELFTDFNKRYDNLNDTLLIIKTNLSYKEVKLNHPEQAKALNDYINLCAEEYFWYKKKRLDKDIWKAWQSGMHYWYNRLSSLRQLWQDEKSGGGNSAFYLNEDEDFFIKDNPSTVK